MPTSVITASVGTLPWVCASDSEVGDERRVAALVGQKRIFVLFLSYCLDDNKLSVSSLFERDIQSKISERLKKKRLKKEQKEKTKRAHK